MKRLPVLLPILALTFACQAGAQTMKPGMWEMTNKVKSSNAETNQAMAAAMKQLAAMPPEQRAQIEALMAQNGASMPKMTGDGINVSACITPEMAARHEVPIGQQGNCTTNNQTVAGGMNISFNCTNPPSSGSGQLRFNGDSGFAMTMNVTTSATGKPQQMTVETTGRWLSANCPAKAR